MECIETQCQIVIAKEKALGLACGEIVKNCRDGFVDLCPLCDTCVMENQKDLVKILTKLSPLAVIKG